MAWTWIKSGNGYALVDSDAPGATPTAVLAKEGGKWILASAAGETPLPSRPTFDHAEKILAAQGIIETAPKPQKAKPAPKAPKTPKPPKTKVEKPPKAPTPKTKPFKPQDLKRLVRDAGSFVGNPATTLRQSREHAIQLASQKGVAEVQAQMRRAHDELVKRLDAALTTGPGEDSFTAVQLQSTLAQVKAVLADLQPGLEGTVVANGKLAATAAAEDAVKYLRESEHKYRGIARPIPIQQAKVLDRAIMGSESSLLNRLQGDSKAGPGILQRYGDAVIQKFEERLQQRMIQGKSVAEVRQDLIKDSEFLQGAPLSWAERIVRTEVMGAHARANYETIKEVDQQTGGGMLKILCATFDSRTGADSYAVHGQIRRSNEPFEDWHHQYMTPPNRPNDREIVVAHFIEWPIPDELRPKSDAEVAARWAELGNKRALPARPLMTTVPLDQIGKRASEKKKPEPAPVETTAAPVQEPAHEPSKPLAMTAEEWEASIEADPDKRYALRFWASSGYRDIRRFQQGLRIDSAYDEEARTKKVANNTRLLIGALDRAPRYEGQIYRGLALTPEQLNEIRENPLMEFEAISSFSSRHHVASDFSSVGLLPSKGITERVVLELKAKNSKAHDISSFGLAGEHEVLMREGEILRVAGYRLGDDGIHYITLEE